MKKLDTKEIDTKISQRLANVYHNRMKNYSFKQCCKYRFGKDITEVPERNIMEISGKTSENISKHKLESEKLRKKAT
jgi:hypothetical protein